MFDETTRAVTGGLAAGAVLVLCWAGPAHAANAPAAASAASAVGKRAADRATRVPTIQMMSDLHASKLAADAQKQLERLYPSAAASAPRPSAGPRPPVRPVIFDNLAAQPTTKRVAAIYGRAGAEAADMERPDGVLVTVRPGSTFEGYRVTRITSQQVELEGSRKVYEPAQEPAPKASTGKTSAGSLPAEVEERRLLRVESFTIKVPVGGTFR